MIEKAFKVAKSSKEKSVFVFDTHKNAKIFEKDLKAFLKYFKKDIPVYFIPEDKEIHDSFAQFKRNYAIFKYLTENKGFFILPKEAFNIEVSQNRDFIKIQTGIEINLTELEKKLLSFGYIKEENPENAGEFSFKGGVLTINIPEEGIFQIDFFGDEVENIFAVSKLLTKKKVDNITLFPLYDFPIEYDEFFDIKFKETEKIKLDEIFTEKEFITQTKTKPQKVLSSDFKTVKLDISQTFIDFETKTIFIPHHQTKFEPEITPLKEGDYIIHEDYGIGIFRGIETKVINGREYDFMVLEYANGEKINVSYLHFDKIHKYEFKTIPKLDQIGGTSWRNIKRKVTKSLEKVASQLIKLYTQREQIIRKPYKLDETLLKQFEESFEFVETPDQKKAIEDIKKDLTSQKPADRIICGDVGFGKTEVAIRASFIASINNKQTLVLTPTTVLSYQHYKKFKERLEPFGIMVENLSRLKTKKQTQEIIQKLEEGKIDVLVGTHKALSILENFKDLGLLIIDEEHRFGVKAKEKIRMLRTTVDTIYMTATPIPRTLSLALHGLKEMSVINTPPEGRIETKTFVSRYSKEVVKKAIQKELNRNGQVFYVHNRIETIEEKAKEIKELFPDTNVDFIHGRMKPKEIEKKILKFINKQTDILVSTSIIETGIDVPTANTLIIERADLFGLAQLYHLRGRVGRSNIQAYCYLLLPEDTNITEDAQKRISTILKLTRPGSGLKVAMEDMKIRGAGNILGVEQSGYIKSVGFDMYVKLLKKTLNSIKGENEVETVIETDFESYIPESLISSPEERMNVYMAVSKAIDSKDIQYLEDHLEEFYSGLPATFKTYLTIEKIRKIASKLGISKIRLFSPVSEVYFGNLKEEKIVKLCKNLRTKKIYPDKVEFFLKPKELNKLYELFNNLKP